MRARFFFIIFIVFHCALLAPFAGHMKQRPVAVKLGYTPHPQIIKMTSADHALAIAEAAVIKVLFYFGSLVEKFHENVIIRPEYPNMYRTLVTAAKLDPYNVDIYYFAQAAFTWELGRIAEVNALLEEGMKYRTWDAYLPFYIGFNHAYFNKNFTEAARYMLIAAERSGNPLYTKLAARYFYESEQTDLGVVFLKTMIEQAKDKAVKQTYQLRLDALIAIRTIEDAVEGYRVHSGTPPMRIEQLVTEGWLEKLPVDPYGGTFYLDETGRVRSTSKLANPGS